MALPKAILCQLSEGEEEAALRSVGYATATVPWRELDSQQHGWIQLLPVLNDPSVTAWVVAGAPEEFTPSVRSKIALMSLALERNTPLQIALRLKRDGDFIDVPPSCSHMRIFQPAEPFGAKLMATRQRPVAPPENNFVCIPRLDPLLGIWLETAPAAGAVQNGFMAGVFGAEVTAFGVGPSGEVPEKSTLFHPMLGIKGDIGGREFCACAAQNPIGNGASCYMRIDGFPEGVFLTAYPEEGAENEGPLRILELV